MDTPELTPLVDVATVTCNTAHPPTATVGEDAKSNALETLQAEVLRLSRADRAKFLDHLIASLHSEAEAMWDALAESRDQEIQDGTTEAVPLEAAMARLVARFPG